MPLVTSLAAIAALAPRIGRPLVIADVGCRWGFADTWRAFGRAATILGFDPDAAEVRRLEGARTADEADDGPDVRYVPHGLGARSGPAAFHRTVEPACASLFPPDPLVIAHRQGNDILAPIGTGTVELTTLDEWAAGAGIAHIDALKLDTQGADLDVIRGAERLLPGVRLIEAEVMLNPLYVGQPLFGDLDRHLRDRGFVLWRLAHLVHYGLAGTRSAFPLPDVQYFDSRPVPLPAQGGQLFWAHAYYVPRTLAFGAEHDDWQGALRDACLLTAHGFRDLAGDALARVVDRAPQDIADAIRSCLEP
jgi:FkbM family methyltransferase